MKKVIIFIFAFLTFFSNYAARTHFRKKDKNAPKITVGWENSTKRITRTNWVFTEYPLFTPFLDYFYKNILPKSTISAKDDPSTLFDCRMLSKLITKLLREVKKRKKEYTDFDILKDTNFNRQQRCGLLILRFKNYPFVLKLFIETPESFIDPYCKGFENQFFFYMSGGMNRHLAGLTRIKNLDLVNEQIKNHERWRDTVITPRKWYWLPRKPRWIEIKGWNIGDKKELTTRIPSVYAIIADELDTKEDAPLLSSQKKSEMIMELCMDLHLFVDPHADNFAIKYNKENNKYLISIVDTEHFPSIVGLKEEPFFNNHFEYYIYLSAKYFQDAFLQTKSNRKLAQNTISPCAIKW